MKKARAGSREAPQSLNVQWTPQIPDSRWISIASDLALSRREAEIARCVLENLDPPEIAARLSITQRTVRAHLEHVYSKLGIRGRCELILLIFAKSLRNEE